MVTNARMNRTSATRPPRPPRLVVVLLCVGLLIVGTVLAWGDPRSWLTTTTTTELPTTTTVEPYVFAFTTPTTTFVPLVASPFSAEELDFLNAWQVIEGYSHRYYEDGVDTDGDGLPDEGWHDPEMLAVPLSQVTGGRNLCGYEEAEYWISNSTDLDREGRERFVLVARAWLC